MVPAIFTLLRLCPRTFAPASYLVSLFLSLSLSPVSAIFDPYPSLFHEEPYTSSASKKEKERERESNRKKKRKGEEIYRLQESPWFPTLVKLPRLRTFPTIDSHSFSPSPSSFPLQSWSLLPFAALPPRLLVSSKLDGLMKFAVRHFYLASLSLFFSLWSREASLRLTLSWRTPDSSWGSSSTEAKFRADARERRKGDEVSFPNDPRTIHKLWKMSQPSRV